MSTDAENGGGGKKNRMTEKRLVKTKFRHGIHENQSLKKKIWKDERKKRKIS